MTIARSRAARTPIEKEKPPEEQNNLPNSIENFLDAANGGEFPCTVYLYKFEKLKTKPERQLIDEFDNEHPSMREIGESYGSGRYELVATWTDNSGKRGIKGAKFSLAKRWDEVRDEIKRTKAYANPAAGPMNSFAESMGMMRELVAVISPLVTAQAKQAQSANNNPAAMLDQISAFGAKMLDSSFSQQMNTQNQMLSMMRDNNMQQIENMAGENAPEESAIDKIVGLLQSFLPMYMNMNKIGKSAMIQQAKNTPEFSQVMSNTATKNALLKKVAAQMGKDKAEEVETILDNSKKKAVKKSTHRQSRATSK